MGAQQSKDELLYQQVNYGNIEGIKVLHRDGAGLEWIDKEGKTPLILACIRPDLLPVAKTLIELGANVNAYRPGSHAGTPLHHAAKRGLEETVNLLLSHGAKPLLMNDDCQTALDLAREKGFCNVVHSIESRICLFAGWLREYYGPSFLETIARNWVTRRIWAVVLPCDSRNPYKPQKFELALYSDLQVARPVAVIALWKVHIEEPKFNQPDPALTMVDKSKKRLYKFFSAQEGDKQQLQWFYNASRGITQLNNPSQMTQVNAVMPTQVQPHILAAPVNAPVSSTSQHQTNSPSILTGQPSSSQEDIDLTMALNASIQSAIAEGVPLPDVQTLTTGPSSANGWVSRPCNTAHNGGGPLDASPPSKTGTEGTIYTGCDMSEATRLRAQPNNIVPSGQETPSPLSVPSAPPIVDDTFYDGPIHYPSIDCTPVDLTLPAVDAKPESSGVKEGSSDSGSCVICLDAPVEGACIPCGHMAGCMSCLKEIKAKEWGCPVCRSKIDQVVKLYAV